MVGSTRRPRAHEVALAIVAPTERLVLAAIARDRDCKLEHLPTGLVAGVRSALMVGMRPLLEELARLMEPQLFSETPLADALEPEKRPESVELVPAKPPPLPAGISPSSRPTAPPPAGYQKSTRGGVSGGGISGDRHIEADDGLEPDFEGERTPTVPLDDYPQIEISELNELDWSDMETPAETPRAKLGTAGKTLPSWPAPPPVPHDVLSAQLRQRGKKGSQ